MPKTSVVDTSDDDNMMNDDDNNNNTDTTTTTTADNAVEVDENPSWTTYRCVNSHPKCVVREAHGDVVRDVAFCRHRSDPSYANMLATVGGKSANVYGIPEVRAQLSARFLVFSLCFRAPINRKRVKHRKTLSKHLIFI
jgi:hypothetical protein